ncbi:MAG: gluconate 2-dehydrogenase subunit 3 family protein [Gemmatimonadaceae bacterium]|nr:gluconate 2-dehydrogenase subunit 3 family protein [Acetobacteraceae bacterium]
MREIDRRTQVSRRQLLRTGTVALPAALVAGASISADAAWAQNAKAIAPHAMATMVKAARDIFPHDHIADSFYIRAITPWDAKAAKDPALKDMVANGVARLDQDAQERHGSTYMAVGWEADRVALLRMTEHTKFFRTLRADLVVSLYNQPEIWPKFGYEGSSAEHGGYIARGFDDINWLPTV